MMPTSIGPSVRPSHSLADTQKYDFFGNVLTSEQKGNKTIKTMAFDELFRDM